VIFPCQGLPDLDEGAVRTTQHSWRGSGTVLLVDDEETVRAVGQQMLLKAGFEVRTASDGREAVEILRQSPGGYCCIILDLTMPVMMDWKHYLPFGRSIPDSGSDLQRL
jgi:PleD family two-component response regulator